MARFRCSRVRVCARGETERGEQLDLGFGEVHGILGSPFIEQHGGRGPWYRGVVHGGSAGCGEERDVHVLRKPPGSKFLSVFFPKFFSGISENIDLMPLNITNVSETWHIIIIG